MTSEKQRDISDTRGRDHIKKQVNSHSGKLEYYCLICKKTIRSRTQKYYHYGCAADFPKKYECEKCGKGFSTRSHLSYHNEGHSSNSYTCPSCNKTFANTKVLQKHAKLHERTQIFTCDICKKQLKSKGSLNAHLAKHNNELHFQCTDCMKKYATKSALEQHKQKHLEKKYVCVQCGKCFQRISILKLHINRHTKTEIYKCKECTKYFSDASALHRHIKTHKEDSATKFKCSKCDVVTLRKDNMNRHIRNMHAGKQFFDCVEILRPKSKFKISDGNECNYSTTSDGISAQKMPKTVANSSVIKFIGKVEPIRIPTQKESTKDEETYNPLLQYRKILDQEEKTVGSEHVETPDEQTLIQRKTISSMSNFSETHWRKNYKYTYQHQEV